MVQFEFYFLMYHWLTCKIFAGNLTGIKKLKTFCVYLKITKIITTTTLSELLDKA